MLPKYKHFYLVLACSEKQTGGADVNRGYDREASFPQAQLLSLLLPSSSLGVACRGRSSAWISATAVRSTTCSTRSRCLGMRMRSGALAVESYSEVGSEAPGAGE
jgi:hypothetical protein